MTGDVRLADLFREFARTMTTDVPIREVVDRLVGASSTCCRSALRALP